MIKKIFFSSVIALLLYWKTVNAGISKRGVPSIGKTCTAICYYTSCVEKAATLIEGMDQSVDPCDDFYQFACGNYIKQQVIPENKFDVNQFNMAQDRLNQKLINKLKSEVIPTDLEAFKKLKVYYKNCLDKAEIEILGAEPLLNLLQRLGGWPVLLADRWKEEDYKWEELMSLISKEGFFPGFPINLYVGLDSMNSQNFTLKIAPIGTVVNDTTDIEIIEAYKSYLIEIAVLLGANRDKANVDMKDLVDFEQKLCKAKSLQQELDDVSPIQNRKTISDLHKEYPDLLWLDVINRILSPSNVTATGNGFVEIYDPKFMSEIGSLIKQTPKRVLANYQILKVINNYDLITYLSQKFLKVELKLLQKIVGLKKFPPREQWCLKEVKENFEIAINSLYVRTLLHQQTKTNAIELIVNIREETKESLKKINWMDDYTRKGALKKIEAMKTLAGYPYELLDDTKIEQFYKNMEITPGKYFDDMQRISVNKKNFHFNKLKQRVEQFAWLSKADVTEVNAYYSFTMNQISIMNF